MTEDARLVSRLYFRLLPAQILLVAMSAVNGIVSGLFAANFVGPEAVGAISLFGPVNLFLSAVSMTLMGGSQILCGKYMGQNQVERTQNIFSVDLLISLVLSAVLSIAFVLAPAAGITRAMTPDPAVLAAFDRYLLGQAAGVPALLLGQQLSAFLSLENQAKRVTLAGVVCAGVNTALNFLFVTVLRMGSFGLALASSMGFLAFLAVQAQYYFTDKSLLKLKRPQGFRDAAEILRTGYPGALTYGYQTIRGFLVNSMIVAWVGSAGLSAFGASDSVLRVFWAVPFGMMAVSRMLMSVSIGEEDRKTLVDIMRVVLRRCLPIMCGISALLILSAVPLTRLFFRDPADPVFGMTVDAFRILPLCMPPTVIYLSLLCYAQASGQKVPVHILSVLDGVVTVVCFSALLMPRLGMNGVYLANVANGLISLLVIPVCSCLARRAFTRDLGQLMGIPDDFGAPEDARIDISVRSLEEVVTVSERVMDFCAGRNIDPRRGYFAGLAMEEMAGNVVDHGFRKDSKPHCADIRVVHKGDDVILRIKDDCVPFNPAERRDLVDPADPVKNLAIRLVYREAKKVDYQNILGLNVLTIRI